MRGPYQIPARDCQTHIFPYCKVNRPADKADHMQSTNPIHPLAQWLADNKKTQAWLAGVIGITQPAISAFLKGKFNHFGLHTAQKIVEATGGAVKLEDLWVPSVNARQR